MKQLHATAFAFAIVLGLVGCGRPPRPAVLAEVDRNLQAPSIQEARELAPQAFAYADALRGQAEEAYADGKIAKSSILGERAIAAFARAVAQARILRASQTDKSTSESLVQVHQTATSLEAEQRRLQADLDALELRIKVYHDAEPLAATRAASDPAREAARLQLSRTLLGDAKLLCLTTKLIGKTPEGLAQAEAELQRLQALLDGNPKTAPIDETRRVRSQCLATLTLARRTEQGPVSMGLFDQLLAEVSNTGDFVPWRDDRGVVLDFVASTREATIGTDKQLKSLSSIAKSHAAYPLLIVTHIGQKVSEAELAAARTKLDTLKKRLVEAGIGADRVHVELLNDRPLDAKAKGPTATDRLEVVIVPTGT
jgi:hypothetical protein